MLSITTTTTIPSDDVALPSKPPSPEKSELCNISSSHWSDDNGSDDDNDSDDSVSDNKLTDIEALEWNNYLSSSSGLCECFRLSTSPNNNDIPDSIIIDYINKFNDGSLSIAVHNFLNGRDTIYCALNESYGTDEYIVNGSEIELLKVKKKKIQDLFGIIINDTLSNSFNNENINIELVQIYDKFSDIKLISYVNPSAPPKTPSCFYFSISY